MLRCVVVGCPSKANRATSRRGVRLHTFPRDLARIEGWLQRTGQSSGDLDRMAQLIYSDRDVADGVRMCSAHFTKDSYITDSSTSLLRADAMPTVFPNRRAAPPPPDGNIELESTAPDRLPRNEDTMAWLTPDPLKLNGTPESTSKKKESRTQAADRVLSLALEIIYLLTGESYGPIKKKSGGPPPPSLTPEGKIDKKILEVTQKIIELLTGEVPIRCQDVSVYFSMEEWEYLEGHKDLYKDVMMENRPPLTSPDGSSKKNPPERYPYPLYSRDSTQEHHEILQNAHKVLQHYSVSKGDSLVIVKVEAEELEGQYGMSEKPCMEEEIPPVISTDPRGARVTPKNVVLEKKGRPLKVKEEEIPSEICTDGSRNIPESCPSTLHSQDFTQEHQEIPQSLLLYARDSTQEHQEQQTSLLYSRESPLEHHGIPQAQNLFSRGSTQRHQELPQCRPLYSRDSTQEHHEIPQARPLYSRDSTQEHHEILQDEEDEDGINIIVKVEADAEGSYVRGDEPCKEEEILPEISTDPGDTRDQTDVRFEDEEIRQVKIKEEDIPVEINTDGQYRRYDKTRHLHIAPVGEIDDNITSSPHEENSSSPNLYPTPHSAHPLPNPLRNGRRFPNHPHSINHHTPHEEDEIFQHSENGGTLTQGVKPILPYACSECGKGFFTKYKLAVRQRIHTTERPYSCSECGKCFTWKEVLVRHQRVHAGEKPFACTECGKCFAQLSHLTCHRRTHTGVKPYSCTECGKCFTRRSSLTAHGRIHRGERPYAHSQCEKCCPGKH